MGCRYLLLREAFELLLLHAVPAFAQQAITRKAGASTLGALPAPEPLSLARQLAIAAQPEWNGTCLTPVTPISPATIDRVVSVSRGLA